ncbi:MAG: glycosyltransferase family 39 protein [Candidatus Margulisbacteria bacterium]|nr:glycosyltransferase family 39 protein [Candidatus Margulisiibacteriota bacterium]
MVRRYNFSLGEILNLFAFLYNSCLNSPMPKKTISNKIKQWFVLGQKFWILLILSAILFLFNSYNTPIIDGDSFYYISHAKKILYSGDWLNLSSLMSKPPLGLWIWALTYKLLGVSLFSTLFWHAAFSFLLIWITYRLAEEIFNSKAALFSALILLSTFQMFYMARTPMLDMSFAVILAGFYLYFYLFLKTKKESNLYLAALMLGLAFINKGLLAFVLPGISIVPFMFFTKDQLFFKKKKDYQKDAIKILLSVFIVFLAIAPWVIPQVIVHRQKFIAYFWEENITRFFHPIDGPTTKPQRDIYMYFIYLAIGFLPWSGYLLSAFMKPWKEKWQNKRRDFIYLLTWIVFPFILFSISGHWKVPRYIFPIFPALAIFLGKYWQDLLVKQGKYLKKSILWGIIISFLFSVPILLFAVAAHFMIFPEQTEVLKLFIFTFLGILFIAVFSGNILVILKKYKEAFYTFFIISFLAYFVFLAMSPNVFSKLLPEKNFCHKVMVQVPANVPIAVWDMPVRSVDFYLKRPVNHFSDFNNLRQYVKNKTFVYIVFKDEKESNKILPYLGKRYNIQVREQNLLLVRVK